MRKASREMDAAFALEVFHCRTGSDDNYHRHHVIFSRKQSIARVGTWEIPYLVLGISPLHCRNFHFQIPEIRLIFAL